MKMILGTLKRLIISPEFLVIIVALVVLYLRPEQLSGFANSFYHSSEAVKYIALLPVAVLVWSLRRSQLILFPDADEDGKLQKWPRFRDLKVAVFVGLIYQFGFGIVSIIVWIELSEENILMQMIILISAILGSIISAGTFYLASIMVMETLKKNAN